MKYRYGLVLLALAVTAFMAPANSAQAQESDTLLVEWLDGDDVVINALYEAIVSDTLADGTRANPDRVYKLQQGGFYYNTERIENNGWHLRIVGEKGDPSDAFANPPMIQLEHREDASRTDKILRGGGDVTLKNLIIQGRTTLGDLPYEQLRFDADDGVVTIDNVVFEFSRFGILGFYGVDSEIYITNSTFRNLVSDNSYYGGRAISIWTDVELIHFENNTLLNVGGLGLQLEGGVADEFWINHNTFVNIGRDVVLHDWHTNTYFTNNLIVNGFWQGEGEEGFNELRLQEEDNQYTGIFSIDALPTRYGLDIERTVVFANNATYREDEFNDYYESTSEDDFPIRPQPTLNQRTLNYFDQYDNMVLVDLIEGVDPGLSVIPDNHEEMIGFVTALREGEEIRPSYVWDPGRDTSQYSIQWPFPEDLTYSNSTLLTAATGGFPLGDLNWFPEEKEAWEQQQDELEQEIRGLVGAPPTLASVVKYEAEDLEFSGDAEVVTMADRQAVRVAGSGEPQWEFELEEGGTYDVTIKHRTWYEDNTPDRATNLVVNGENVGTVTLGQEITSDLPWVEAIVEDVAFEAGTNTVTLGYGWGYMEYESVILRDQEGEVVKALYASRADLNGADRVCTGTLCAGGDAYVDLQSSALTVPVTIDNAGTHVVTFNYLIPEGDQATADLLVNGSTVTTVDFSGSADAMSFVLSDEIELDAGANEIEVSSVSGSVGIDDVEVFMISSDNTAIEKELPDGFALNQNYPNPFNPSTTITYSLGTSAAARVVVYDVLGRKVRTLVDGHLSAGTHSVTWNGRTGEGAMAASGIYFYRLETGEVTATRQMLLLK